jgi:prepilin-type N-terminal cleavage/methylation domain-containing protein
MNRERHPGRSEGFTLIEVMVALMLTSLVVLVAHQLLAGVVDGAAALRRSAPLPTGPLLGREWALEACQTLEVGTPETHGFEGTASSARFDARLVTAEGWVERQGVTIEVREDQALIRTGAITATIVDSAEAPTLDYLSDGAGDGGWVMGWSSPVSAPLAIRIRWVRAGVADTILCPIGARG